MAEALQGTANSLTEQSLWLWPLSPAYMGAASRQGLILGFGSTKAW